MPPMAPPITAAEDGEEGVAAELGVDVALAVEMLAVWLGVPVRLAHNARLLVMTVEAIILNQVSVRRESAIQRPS